MIDTLEALDILEMFDMFQGQRAGRELWSEKPKEIQDVDIENFSKRVSILKEFIIKQQNEIDVLRNQCNTQEACIEYYKRKLEFVTNELWCNNGFEDKDDSIEDDDFLELLGGVIL